MTDVTDEPVEPVEDPDEIPAPDPHQDLTDYALDWLQTSVVNVISTKLVPQLIGWGGLTLFLAKLQDWIGLNLPPSVVATYVGLTLAGIAGKGIAYVRNHGQGAAILGQALLKVQEVGQLGVELTPPGLLHPGSGGGENVVDEDVPEDVPIPEPMPGDEIVPEEPMPGETPIDPSVPPGISEGRIDQ